MPDITKRAFTQHHKITSIKKVGDSNLYRRFYISFCKGSKWQWGVVWLYFHLKFMFFFLMIFHSFPISLLSYYTKILGLCCTCVRAYEKDHSHSTTPKVAADILQSLLNDISWRQRRWRAIFFSSLTYKGTRLSEEHSCAHKKRLTGTDNYT